MRLVAAVRTALALLLARRLTLEIRPRPAIATAAMPAEPIMAATVLIAAVLVIAVWPGVLLRLRAGNE